MTIDTSNRIWLTAHPRKKLGGKGGPDDPMALIRNGVGYPRHDAAGRLIDTVMVPALAGEDEKVTALNIGSSSWSGAIREVPYASYPRFAVSPLGHLISAMSRPYAVHTTADGKPVRITREFVPPRVDEEERAQHRANIEFVMRGEKSDFTWNGPDVPHEKPPVAGIAVGLDGRISVQLSVPSEAFEPDPPTRPGERRPPPVKFRPTEQRWDVFESDGRYLGRIAAERSVTVYARRGNLLWGVIRDEDDVAAIVRMHIDPALAAASSRRAFPRTQPQ